MKKIIYAVIVLFAVNTVNAKQIVEKTVAVVNGEHILLSEYEKVVNPYLDQYKKAVTKDEDLTDEKIKQLKEKILDEMVNEKLMLQKAKSDKFIKVTKRDIEKAVEQVKGRFKTEEEFSSELKKEGLTALQFETRIKDQLLQIKLIDNEVKSKVGEPDEKQVKEFYDKIKAIIDKKEAVAGTEGEKKELQGFADLVKRNFSELARVRHILVKSEKDDSMTDREAAKKKLQDIKKKIDSGEDFSEMAVKYSNDPGSAERGGDLGYMAKGDIEGFDSVFSLQVGAVSDIVKTDYGFHLVKVEEKKAARTITFDALKKDLAEYVMSKNAEKKYEQWLKELRAKATIKTNPIE